MATDPVSLDSSQATPSPKAGEVFCVDTHCLDLKCDATVAGSTLCRLRTAHGVFFFRREQFDAQATDDPHPDERLLIGARRLHDGSAWLYWLRRANGNVWRPRPAPPAGRLAAIGLVLLSLAMVAAAVFPASAWSIMLQVLFGLAGAASLGVAVYRLALRMHPGRRRLLAALATLDSQGELALAEHPRFEAAPPLALADGVQHGVGILQGRASNVTLALQTVGSGRYRHDYRSYQFSCKGEHFTKRASFGDFAQILDPLFFRRAPLFIGEGDQLALLTLVADGNIHGILNLDDGRAHIDANGSSRSALKRWAIQSLIGLIIAFMTVIIALVVLNDWISSGLWPDYWDWRELVELYGFVILVTLAILVGLIGGIIERIQAWQVRRKGVLPVEKVLGIAFQWRLRQGLPPTLNEFG